MSNQTFTIIKPIAVGNGHTGAILKMIEASGFKILALKKTQLNLEDARKFYAIHKEKSFFKDLVQFMVSGPIYVAILQKNNAVAEYRKLIGSTDPLEAAEETIRKLYATSKEANAVHGSDSDENALIESNFFFSSRERIN